MRVMRYFRFAQELYNLNLSAIRQKIRNSGIVWPQITDYSVLPQMVHEEAQCCFVLSTGRCGTLLLTKLLELSKEVRCQHAPSPQLVYFSKLAYEAFHEDSETFRLGIDMARYELIREAFKWNQVYVETNNRITFFAPFLAEVFKRAKFIHLVRHPGDFVRTGIRRKWYTGKQSHDAGRIIPVDKSKGNWNGMTQIEKIAWLWNETNQFIEDFKSTFKDPNRILFFKAEDLFSEPDTTLKIFEFLQVEPPPETKIIKMIRDPVNKQVEGDFPAYDQWDFAQKEQLKKYAILYSKYY